MAAARRHRVLNAGLIVAFSNSAPLALVPATFAPAKALVLLVFAGPVVWLYGWMLVKGRGQTDDG